MENITQFIKDSHIRATYETFHSQFSWEKGLRIYSLDYKSANNCKCTITCYSSVDYWNRTQGSGASYTEYNIFLVATEFSVRSFRTT